MITWLFFHLSLHAACVSRLGLTHRAEFYPSHCPVIIIIITSSSSSSSMASWCDMTSVPIQRKSVPPNSTNAPLHASLHSALRLRYAQSAVTNPALHLLVRIRTTMINPPAHMLAPPPGPLSLSSRWWGSWLPPPPPCAPRAV